MGSKRVLIALTPLAGAVTLPIVVPLMMSKVSLTASLLTAVVLASAWFVLMLRSSEMPGHH